MKYGFSKIINSDFDSAIEQVTAKLKEEGFGVLTSIDVKKTLKDKINVDFKNYVILGACNPPLAHQALTAEEDLGLMLPCNVVLSEDTGGTKVSFFDPEVMGAMIENDEVKKVSKQVKEKLNKVFNKL